MTLSEFSAWVTANQALVSLVATPIISLIVGAGGAWYSGKRALAAAQTERRHQSALEIVRFRQTWITAFQEAFVEIVENCSKVQRTANEDYPFVMARVAKLEVMIDPTIPDHAKLQGFLDQLRHQDHSNVQGELTVVAQRILKRERERLQEDLANVEEGKKR